MGLLQRDLKMAAICVVLGLEVPRSSPVVKQGRLLLVPGFEPPIERYRA